MTITPGAAPPPEGTAAPSADPPAAPQAGPTQAGPWRRLSRRMLLVHPVQELIRSIPVLLGVLLAGSSRGHGPLWSLAAVAALVLLGLARWFTTTYQITASQVLLRRGLINRRVLTVPRDRIRTVDVTSHALHRVLGLARVTIGTGQSDRGDKEGIKLDALRATDAAYLHEELLHRAPPAGAAPAASPAADAGRETELLRLRPIWARYGPFTLSGFVTVGVIAAFGSHILSEANVSARRIGPVRDTIDQLSQAALPVAVAEVVVATLVLVALASTTGYVLAFWNFRLTRHTGGTLRVTRGLLTSRATTIEERRLRGVELSEPLLLRAVRGARCIAITTGLRVGRGSERGGSLLVPPVPAAQARRVAGEVLGGPAALTTTLAAHGTRARLRRYTRAITGSLIVTAVLALGWWLGIVPAWVPPTSLVLVPCAALVAADRYRSLGHALTGGYLVTGQGSLVRRRCVLSCDGIIGWNLHRSYFQRRAGLLTLSATTAAGRQHYPCRDVTAAEALRTAEAATPGLITPFLITEEGPYPKEPQGRVQ